MPRMSLRLALALAAATLTVQDVSAAQDIVRCKDARGGLTYQPAPCPDRTEESRPGISNDYPAPNIVERDRLFEREAALDKRLEARRDRETMEQQMREARAEREAERERLAVLAAVQQPQYYVAYPNPWPAYPVRFTPRPMPRHSGQAIFR